MSKVVVVGCGRSGTNIALEMLRWSPSLDASEPPENQSFFKSTAPILERYLTKCDTQYFTLNELLARMNLDQNLRIVWTIRDPRDMALSKLYRGRPTNVGGDCVVLADDATPDGCVADIRDMYIKLKRVIAKHWRRVLIVKMESMISDPHAESWSLSKALRIGWDPKMANFWKTQRHKMKAARYPICDQSQIGLWTHWQDVYDGYFVGAGIDVEDLFLQLSEITEDLDYAV